MTDKLDEKLQCVLPVDILARTYRISNGEMAWNRADTLRVLPLLRQAGLTLLGIDIWVPEPKAPRIPEPYIYFWDTRCPESAEEYVRDFEWDENDLGFRDREPYFNLTYS
jgi:hypothetical protein